MHDRCVRPGGRECIGEHSASKIIGLADLSGLSNRCERFVKSRDDDVGRAVNSDEHRPDNDDSVTGRELLFFRCLWMVGSRTDYPQGPCGVAADDRCVAGGGEQG